MLPRLSGQRFDCELALDDWIDISQNCLDPGLSFEFGLELRKQIRGRPKCMELFQPCLKQYSRQITSPSAHFNYGTSQQWRYFTDNPLVIVDGKGHGFQFLARVFRNRFFGHIFAFEFAVTFFRGRIVIGRAIDSVVSAYNVCGGYWLCGEWLRIKRAIKLWQRIKRIYSC